MTDYAQVPVPYMADAVKRYLEHGAYPGSFLLALFGNDLKGAFRCADHENTLAMRQWVVFMIDHMPYDSQGSPEIVHSWMVEHHPEMSPA